VRSQAQTYQAEMRSRESFVKEVLQPGYYGRYPGLQIDLVGTANSSLRVCDTQSPWCMQVEGSSLSSLHVHRFPLPPHAPSRI
jgi:hypothetical protein